MVRSHRRLAMPALTLASALSVLGASAHSSAGEAVTQTRSSQAALSPADALRMLDEGNKRFVSRKPLDRDYIAQVEATTVITRE